MSANWDSQLPAALLEESPSQRDGISLDDETAHRVFGCEVLVLAFLFLSNNFAADSGGSNLASLATSCQCDWSMSFPSVFLSKISSEVWRLHGGHGKSLSRSEGWGENENSAWGADVNLFKSWFQFPYVFRFYLFSIICTKCEENWSWFPWSSVASGTINGNLSSCWLKDICWKS